MSFPLIYISGNIKYTKASPIFIKSQLTKALFPFIWFAFKLFFFLNFFKPKLISFIKKNNEFVINGIFLYRTRDKRKRTYCILNTNEGDFFVKKGKDVQIEELELKILRSLLKNNFKPILPVKTYFFDSSSRVNLYNFKNNYSTNNRLSIDESIKFSNSLNKFNSIDEISIAEYVEKINASNQLYFSKNFKVLLELSKNHMIKLGNIHGDLMSNNILRTDNIINILDWESFSHNQPLVIDYIGALDWGIINDKIHNITYEKNSITNFEFDLISFLIITYTLDFNKSKDLINSLFN
jgi:hypothetical protein